MCKRTCAVCFGRNVIQPILRGFATFNLMPVRRYVPTPHEQYLAAAEELSEVIEAAQDRLPLSRSWFTNADGLTMNGPFVCGTCDGGGCGDCVD